MKALYILKAGTTFPVMLERFSDFDTWIKSAISCPDLPIKTIDIEHEQPFPNHEKCAGIIISGSHDMITNQSPWSVSAEKQLQPFLNAEIPILGICYGHHLLAQSSGGNIGFHPGGTEAGTTGITLLPAAARDPLFSRLPAEFSANVFHQQTVQYLPPQAVCLASNSFEKTHAFRIGSCAWGIQFHPEFSAAIMKAYISEDARDMVFQGRNPPQLLSQVRDTPVSASILQLFAEFCLSLHN